MYTPCLSWYAIVPFFPVRLLFTRQYSSYKIQKFCGIPLELCRITHSIRSLTSWASECCLPLRIRGWEGALRNWVERIRIQRVLERFGRAVSHFNADLLLSYNLGWRDGIGRPVPVWKTETRRGILPVYLVRRSIRGGDLNNICLKNLLKVGNVEKRRQR